MAWKQEQVATRNGKLIGMICFTGVALFVVELGAGLDYVQARLGSLMPGFLGFLPAVGIATSKVLGTAFWNYGQWERTFWIVPFITLPFLLVGLALCLRYKRVFQEQPDRESEQH